MDIGVNNQPVIVKFDSKGHESSKLASPTISISVCCGIITDYQNKCDQHLLYEIILCTQR